MTNHIMIDIESLNTTPDCVILSIGAVRFDPNGIGVIEALELKPTIEDQTEIYNRSISEPTLAWWSKQSTSALDEALSPEGRLPLADCMEQLYSFCWNNTHFWSHGAPFDLVVMENAWSQTSTRPNPFPWPFYALRDTRTLFDIAGVKLQSNGYVTSHKAVEDALRQAEVVQKAYMILKKAGINSK